MAATETTGIIDKNQFGRTFVSAGPLTRGTLLAQGGSDNVLVAAGAGQQSVGVLNESVTAAGQPLSVTLFGEAPAIAGAAGIAAGAYLISNAAGQVVPSAATGDQVVGRALSSAALAGDYLVIFFSPFVR